MKFGREVLPFIIVEYSKSFVYFLLIGKFKEIIYLRCVLNIFERTNFGGIRNIIINSLAI